MRIAAMFPSRLKAIFLHVVSASTDRSLVTVPKDRVVHEAIPVLYFKTYVGAATKAYKQGKLHTHSLTYSLTHLLTHSFTHSLTHGLGYISNDALMRVVSQAKLDLQSITPMVTHSLTHPLTYSLTHSLTYSPTFTHPLIHRVTVTLLCIKVVGRN